MRRNDKRVVVLSDKTEDAGYGIMHVSTTMETEYDISSFPNCEKRTDGRAEKATLFVMNHFYGWQAVPGMGKYLDSKVPNRFNATAKRVGICVLQEGRWPNFLAVDNVGFLDGGERKVVLIINEINKEHCCIGRETVSKNESVAEEKDKESHEPDIGDNVPDHDEL